MTPRSNSILTLGAALLAATAITSVAGAQSVESFYKGKEIRLTSSSDVGGGYDATARLLARFMPNHMPGNPRMIVQNMPGAGGIKAANYL